MTDVPELVYEQFELNAIRLEPLADGHRHAMFRHRELVVRFELDPVPAVRSLEVLGG
jgi:hypothetical protein